MRRIFLILVLVLAAGLRLIGLGNYPVGFTPDEASFGYDAYSIMTTGKDQWGQSFPLVLESFGDFKPPLYSYLTIPSTAVFGLNKFSVRLPNAILGTLAVAVVYFLAKEMTSGRWSMTKSTDKSKSTINHQSLAIVASFLFAISPWHIMLSRGAFEANLTTFFMPLGILLFLKGLKSPKFMTLSALSFGLNLFSYHSARLVTPLIVLTLIWLWRKDLFSLISNLKNAVKSHYGLSLIIFGMFLALSFYTLLLGGATRAKDISIFNGALDKAFEQRTQARFAGLDASAARVFHNKYQVISRRFIDNYTQYTSYSFLFKDGPAEATYGMIPGRGVLYWFELVFLVGFLYSFFKLRDKRFLYLLMAWIIFAPIPASLTTGRGYAANRAAVMMPAIQMISAVGAILIFGTLREKFSKRKYKVLLSGAAIFVLVSFAGFLEDYFILSPRKVSNQMLHGNLEAARWLSENDNNKELIIVSKRLSEPHIFVAFAKKWDPEEYQEATTNWKYESAGLPFVDQLPRYSLGKYTFKDIGADDLKLESTYVVGKPENFPVPVNVVHSIKYPTGETAIIVADSINDDLIM